MNPANLEGEQLAELRHDVELDAVDGSGQRDASNQQNEEDDVGQGRRHVHHLSKKNHQR